MSLRLETQKKGQIFMLERDFMNFKKDLPVRRSNGVTEIDR